MLFDLSFLFGATVADLNKLTWKNIEAKIPTPRNACATAVVVNELLVFGGKTEGDRILSIVEAFHAKEKSWRALPSMPTARDGCAAVSITDGKVLVMGGFDGSFYLNRVEMLGVETGTWITLPSMKTKRYGCCAGMVANYVIAAGGFDGRRRLVSAELYNPTTQKWTNLPNMKYPHSFGAMAVIGTKVYVFGGSGESRAEVFDLEIRQWASLPSMSMLRNGCAAVVVENFILVLGGDSDIVEVLDVESHTWSTLQKLPTVRQFCAAEVVEDQALAVGGIDIIHGMQQLSTVASLNMRDCLWPYLPNYPNGMGMERRQRKAALKKWAAKASTIKQEYFAAIESATVRVNKKYTKERQTQQSKHAREMSLLESELESEKKGDQEAECARKRKALETDNETKMKLIDSRYRKRQEALEDILKRFNDQLEDVKDQIHYMELRLGYANFSGSIGNHDDEQTSELVSMIYCPITGNIMVDPVVAADGHTYERSAIEDVFSQTLSDCDVLSPVTTEPLAHRYLIPNAAIRTLMSP